MMNNTRNTRGPEAVAYLTGQLSDAPRPGAVTLPGQGGKFATDGSVQYWPGNTFICHVEAGSDAHMGIRAVQEEVKMSPFGRFFTFLPPSSFHMTVFEGVSSRTHDVLGHRRDALSAALLQAVEGLRFDSARTVGMVDIFCGYRMTVTGAEPGGEAALRAIRTSLREATAINPPDFEGYAFHISLGYLLEWLTEPVARDLAAFSAELTDRYAESLASIPLGPVEFCNFETMHHFEPLKRLW